MRKWKLPVEIQWNQPVDAYWWEQCKRFLTLTNAVTLKKRTRIPYLLIYFTELSLDPLVKSWGNLSVTAEWNIRKQTNSRKRYPIWPPVPIVIAVCQWHPRIPWVQQIEVFKANIRNFASFETLLVMIIMVSTLSWLCSFRRNSAVLHKKQVLMNFPHIQKLIRMKTKLKNSSPQRFRSGNPVIRGQWQRKQ